MPRPTSDALTNMTDFSFASITVPRVEHKRYQYELQLPITPTNRCKSRKTRLLNKFGAAETVRRNRPTVAEPKARDDARWHATSDANAKSYSRLSQLFPRKLHGLPEVPRRLQGSRMTVKDSCRKSPTRSLKVLPATSSYRRNKVQGAAELTLGFIKSHGKSYSC